MDRRYRLLVTLGLVIFAQPALAQEQGAKPAVHAKSAMASSSNPTVTKAMVDVMKKGGTALDAVLTAVPMQAVIEPQMTTLAGGVSILYYDAKTKEYHYLDAELDHTRDAQVGGGWAQYTGGGGERVPATSGKRIGIPGTAPGVIGYLAGRWLYRWFRKAPPARGERERMESGRTQS